MLTLLLLVDTFGLAYSCISTPLSSSSCACTYCPCPPSVPSAQRPPIVPQAPQIPAQPQIHPTVVQPLQPSSVQYVFSSPTPRNPFNMPVNEPTLPESPPYFFFTPPSKVEEPSSYLSEPHKSATSYEVPQAPPTARMQHRPAGDPHRPHSYRLPEDAKLDSLVTLRSAPPATQPTRNSQIEIVIPMTTSFSYAEVTGKPTTGRRPAPPDSYMTAPQAPNPESAATLPTPSNPHSSVTERAATTYMVEGEPEISSLASAELRDDLPLTTGPEIARSGYSSPVIRQIEVKSSNIAKEMNEFMPIPKIGEEDAKPMFMTYYNQECNGVMVAMLDNTTVLQATDECLKLGCKAVNAQVHPNGSYTFTYLTSVKSRSNRRGFYCMSVDPVPLTQRDEPARSSSKFTERDKLLENPYNTKPFHQRR